MRSTVRRSIRGKCSSRCSGGRASDAIVKHPEMITDALHKIATHRQSLSREEARDVMSEVLRGDATNAQIAALLVALHMKGETVEEIVGFAEAIRGAATSLDLANGTALDVSGTERDALVDTCGTGGDTSGRLSGACAFEHITDVGVAVLDRASEVGMSRSRPCDIRTFRSGRSPWHLALDVHRLLPVHPVTIANQKRDRRTGRDAVTHSREHLGAIAFDLHATAASVAALATAELQVQRVDIELEAGGHAVNGDDQRLAVRLARGQKSKHSSVILYEGSIRPVAVGSRKRRLRPQCDRKKLRISRAHRPDSLGDRARRPGCIWDAA